MLTFVNFVTMLKGIAKNIASVSMAFLVLFATLSFTISEHYCGNELQDVAWFVKADTCGMEMAKTDSPEGCSIVKDNCCNDVVKTVKGQDELQSTTTQITFQQQIFLAAFYTTFIDETLAEQTTAVSYTHYSPPLIVRDIQLLDDVFLI